MLSSQVLLCFYSKWTWYLNQSSDYHYGQSWLLCLLCMCHHDSSLCLSLSPSFSWAIISLLCVAFIFSEWDAWRRSFVFYPIKKKLTCGQSYLVKRRIPWLVWYNEVFPFVQLRQERSTELREVTSVSTVLHSKEHEGTSLFLHGRRDTDTHLMQSHSLINTFVNITNVTNDCWQASLPPGRQKALAGYFKEANLNQTGRVKNAKCNFNKKFSTMLRILMWSFFTYVWHISLITPFKDALRWCLIV